MFLRFSTHGFLFLIRFLRVLFFFLRVLWSVVHIFTSFEVFIFIFVICWRSFRLYSDAVPKVSVQSIRILLIYSFINEGLRFTVIVLQSHLVLFSFLIFNGNRPLLYRGNLSPMPRVAVVYRWCLTAWISPK